MSCRAQTSSGGVLPLPVPKWLQTDVQQTDAQTHRPQDDQRTCLPGPYILPMEPCGKENARQVEARRGGQVTAYQACLRPSVQIFTNSEMSPEGLQRA